MLEFDLTPKMQMPALIIYLQRSISYTWTMKEHSSLPENKFLKRGASLAAAYQVSVVYNNALK